eukprot:755259-Hanusia_phi.AAC.1
MDQHEQRTLRGIYYSHCTRSSTKRQVALIPPRRRYLPQSVLPLLLSTSPAIRDKPRTEKDNGKRGKGDDGSFYGEQEEREEEGEVKGRKMERRTKVEQVEEDEEESEERGSRRAACLAYLSMNSLTLSLRCATCWDCFLRSISVWLTCPLRSCAVVSDASGGGREREGRSGNIVVQEEKSEGREGKKRDELKGGEERRGER